MNRRQRRQTRRVRSLLRRGQRIALGVFAVVLLSFLGALVAAAVWYADLTTALPPVSQVEEFLDPASGPFLQPTRIYDRSGQRLLLALENPGISRRYLKFDPAEPDHVSPELVRVTIGLVDPGFWQHPGFLWSNLTAPQPVTIAERLVADLLLSQEPADLRRALRMRILAAELVNQEGRSKVLEWYLNSAFYGHLAYGAESAARLYLDKSATDLTLADAALLVPLTAAPALNPIDAFTAALERRNAALEILLEQGTISPQEYQRALDTQPRLAAGKAQSASLAPAFTNLVIAQAAAVLGQGRLERGGLRLITTLDYDLQMQAACLLSTQLNRMSGGSAEPVSLPDGAPCQAARLLPTLQDGGPLPGGLSASVVLLDPRSGQVLALLGDTQRAAVGQALLPHAPGSLLSPFAAVAEFARGYSPASLVWDIPSASVSEQVVRLSGTTYRGPLRLRQAIANDYLAPQLDLVNRLGAAYVWRLAASLGLQGVAEERSAEALYSGAPVSPLDMASAYAVLAAQGTANGRRPAAGRSPTPNLLLYGEDIRGTLLFDYSQPESQSLLSPALAYLVHNVLADEPARWPSLGFPNPLEIGRPAGAKTGSAFDQRQVWAAGYTPQRLAVIWVGLDQESPARLDPRQAAAVWHALIQYASRDLPAEDWPVPPGLSRISVCDPSGQLPTPACPAVVEEVFLNGNEPVSTDTLYRAVQVNRETGRLATVFTPPALVEERVYMAVPAEARLWAEAAGLSLAPEVYDIIQPPETSPQVRLSAPALFAYVSGQVQVRGSAGGDGFVSYRLQAGEGLNPQTWLQIGEESRQAVAEGVLGVWDTSGLDGLYALRLVVVRADSQVETAILQVTVDNTPPLARVTYPINGQEFALPADRVVSFLAEASDGVGIARLEWFLDGKSSGENLVPPYSLSWTAAVGEHRLTVRAVDLAGNSSESVPVPFTVKR
jgi:membrane peptidoglycan carboxypeptidase